MNLTQALQSTVNAEVSSVTNFNPPCAGIFLPAIRNKKIIANASSRRSPSSAGSSALCAYRLGSCGNVKGNPCSGLAPARSLAT